MPKLIYDIDEAHARQLVEAGRQACIADAQRKDGKETPIPYRRNSNKFDLWVEGYITMMARLDIKDMKETAA